LPVYAKVIDRAIVAPEPELVAALGADAMGYVRVRRRINIDDRASFRALRSQRTRRIERRLDQLQLVFDGGDIDLLKGDRLSPAARRDDLQQQARRPLGVGHAKR
jgi:hypothetical protein